MWTNGLLLCRRDLILQLQDQHPISERMDLPGPDLPPSVEPGALTPDMSPL